MLYEWVRYIYRLVRCAISRPIYGRETNLFPFFSSLSSSSSAATNLSDRHFTCSRYTEQATVDRLGLTCVLWPRISVSTSTLLTGTRRNEVLICRSLSIGWCRRSGWIAALIWKAGENWRSVDDNRRRRVQETYLLVWSEPRRKVRPWLRNQR